jgi:NADH-quinone oxidoreductase subunit F
MTIKNIDDLEGLAQIGRAQINCSKPRLIFGLGTCGIASGGQSLMTFATDYLKQLGVEAEITTVGCIGLCHAEPLVDVELPGRPRVTYRDVTEEKIRKIIDEHVVHGKPLAKYALGQITREPTANDHYPILRQNGWDDIPEYQDVPFLSKQLRIVLRNCGLINPDSIEQYIARGGYTAAFKAIYYKKPEQIIDEMKRSGLRGRGGAGFPTGLKWDIARKALGEKKFIICNADEGDPGAYMNRAVLEGDPHSVIEGMIIGAYAMGADEGYIYVRAEYPLAVKTITKAIRRAEELGILGDHVFGSGFSFKLRIMEGAGAFVCGEETALMASIEGKRGEPHPRPPFPAESGLFGKPTNVNNVETWNTAAFIMDKGADWFCRIGTERSKGTKVFSLVGKIERSGLVEIPLGTPLREVIYDIGGGCQNGRKFKAVQTGGPSGGCIPAEHLDIGIDYETLKELGAILGSGGMVVMDEDTCMVDVARYFLGFTTEESCGKCTPCRFGLRRMLEILERITIGEGEEADLATLSHVAVQVRDASLCALGGTAPNPVLTTLKYFKEEYLEHIRRQKCEASVCAALFRSPCQNTCPAETNVPGYIQLIKQRRYLDAYALNLADNPFPSVCGRVCEHPCESRCQRGQLDEPMNIHELKRFCADKAFETDEVPNLPRQKPNGRKVAVIGGGPAGLSAAYFLARLGYHVTIFEASDALGGMMRWAIPSYRLPDKILDREIRNIINLGVEVKLKSKVGENIEFSRIAKEYEAIFVAVGAQKSQKLGVEGEDMAGVLSGLEFLEDVKRGKQPQLGRRVLVIGGGDVAIDVARTAKRLGAEEVVICYRRGMEDMPAYREGQESACIEGIEFRTCIAPQTMMFESGRVVGGVVFEKMKMGGYDKNGRRKPMPTGETVEIKADTVVSAVGQTVDAAFGKGLSTGVMDESGRIRVDKYTLSTKEPNVFAGGDAVTGPASVIEAVAQGKQAARSIDKLLSGKDHFQRLKAKTRIRYSMRTPKNEERMERQTGSRLHVSTHTKGFHEVIRRMEEKCAAYEAKRCLRCDIMTLEGRE